MGNSRFIIIQQYSAFIPLYASVEGGVDAFKAARFEGRHLCKGVIRPSRVAPQAGISSAGRSFSCGVALLTVGDSIRRQSLAERVSAGSAL
jgi:hypothetical protein